MTWQTLLFGTHGLQWADLASLFLHFLTLSMLAIGGAITTAPDMHRYVVGERHWISDADFTASVALAQAAPGPNVLFVAVIGYNVAGLAGVASTLGGSLIPSTVVAVAAARWGHERRETRGCHNRSDYPSADESLQVNLVWSPQSGVTREEIPPIPAEIAELMREVSTVGKLVE